MHAKQVVYCWATLLACTSNIFFFYFLLGSSLPRDSQGDLAPSSYSLPIMLVIQSWGYRREFLKPCGAMDISGHPFSAWEPPEPCLSSCWASRIAPSDDNWNTWCMGSRHGWQHARHIWFNPLYCLFILFIFLFWQACFLEVQHDSIKQKYIL